MSLIIMAALCLDLKHTFRFGDAGGLANRPVSRIGLCHTSRHKCADRDPAAGHPLDGEDVHDWGAPRAPDLGPRCHHGGSLWGWHLCVCRLHHAMVSPLPQAPFQGGCLCSMYWPDLQDGFGVDAEEAFDCTCIP